MMWLLASYSLILLISSGLVCADRYKLDEKAVINRLLEYLRIDSVTQNYNAQIWEAALKFWEREAALLDLDHRVYYPKSKPVVVMSMAGTRPELPSIIMNTHMDVVPIQDQEMWLNSPFEPLLQNGTIIARGAQDCKSLAIQQLEVFRYYRDTHTRPMRTLHMTLMPDEETGSFEGMQAFIKTEEFRRLNVGFVLDEGLSSNDSHFYATYLDKRPWQMHFHIRGSTGGHGAFLRDGTAVEKMVHFLEDVFAFRKEQIKLAESVDMVDYGAYTSVNVNVIQAGTTTNVVPSSADVTIDMRLSTHANITEIKEMVEGWLEKNAGANSTLRFERQQLVNHATAVDDSNPYWVAMKNFSAKVNKLLKPIVCPATSDMSYIRPLGIPAIGFAPNINTVSRIHSTNEYITTETFLNGCQYYIELIRAVTSVPPN